MHHLFQPVNHLRTIRRWALPRRAQVLVDGLTLGLRIECQGRELRFDPRFSIRTQRGLAYAKVFPDKGGGFIGWLPYEVKRWALSTDKLAFKAWCEAHGLKTPRYADSAAGGLDDGASVLVKARRGSFGEQVHGPYQLGAGATLPALEPAEFAEEFIVGRPAKVWYWNETPVALEAVEPPSLVGDGERSIAQMLAQPRGSFDRAHTAEGAQAMLRWQGLDENTVLEKGRQVGLGYKYVTPYDRTTLLNRNTLEEASPGVKAQLQQAGRVLYQGIPPELRAHTLYTLDGVLDAEDMMWWLEMNSNPMVHPDAYGAMLEDIFAAERPARAHAR